MLLKSHGGQIAVMEIVARDLRIRNKMVMVADNWFAMRHPAGVLVAAEAQHGIHAGNPENSVMLALHPGFAQIDKTRMFAPTNAGLADENTHLDLTPAGRIAGATQDIHPDGAAGDPTRATPEKSRAFIDRAAQPIVFLPTQVQRLSLSFPDNDGQQ